MTCLEKESKPISSPASEGIAEHIVQLEEVNKVMAATNSLLKEMDEKV
eukprot:CAMPEP_0172487688 /NCGR_PEP_ID=MMETSP1066-20121228/16867_1 /TAXON_ID=671091 /ORGANISM="Coscinodiscus wailesii, Strain CCMP2513" /LENGTH=47 /DNA_ID= /DNA_START= /DNA_END= /DNA_ORIENTATION=